MVFNAICHSRLPLLAVLVLFLLLLAGGCTSQPTDTQTATAVSPSGQSSTLPCLTSRQAMNSVGKTACVEFNVGNPSQFKGEVFLNEMADYTKGFQAVILADSASQFENPVSQYRYKTIRVSGLIVEYDGHPGIIVKSSSDIIVVK
jgi:hypothetical protein